MFEFLRMLADNGVGLLLMLAIFVAALWYAYRPKNKKRHEAAGRSVLDKDLEAKDRK